VTGDAAPQEQPPGQTAPRGRLLWERLAIAGNLEYDRVLFFSDAIFAIAITLLVVDIRVPSGHGRPVDAAAWLRESVPQMVGFGVSFAVIGMFWVGHHGIFRHIVAVNRWIIWLNLFFLGTIAFLPFPTALLASAGQVAGTVFYATWVALAGLAELAVWLAACRTRGALSAETGWWVRRYVTLRLLRLPVVFLLSVPVAFVSPSLATYLWVLVAVAGLVIRRVMGRPGEPAEDHIG
jgi:uncharacterized membrane protein